MGRKQRVPFTIEEAARIASFIGGDGHSILSMSFVETMGGVDPKKIEPFVEVHKSDTSDHKSTIYPSGGCGMPGSLSLKECRGVYTLTLLRAACNDVGGTPEAYFGRGRQAQAAVEEILRIATKAGVSWPTFDEPEGSGAQGVSGPEGIRAQGVSGPKAHTSTSGETLTNN